MNLSHRKWAKLRALLLVLAICMLNIVDVRAHKLPSPDLPEQVQDLNSPVEFTGQDHVDLMWSYSELGYDSFRIYRDNVLIQTVNYSTDFYRDSGVSNGGTYLYKVCAYNSTSESEYCGGLAQYAYVGQISGNLRQSVSWSGDNYYIAWPVHVYSGATLNIGANALLWSGSTKQPLDDEQGGAIQLDGARVGTHLVLSNSASSLNNTIVYDQADITVGNDLTITGNTFTETASLTLNGFPGNPVGRTVSNNKFQGDSILYALNVEALITSNEFQQASIMIGDNAGAIIQNNLFIQRGAKLPGSSFDYWPEVRVDTATSVVLRDNTWENYFTIQDPVVTAGISIITASPVVTIDSNIFSNASINSSSVETYILNNIIVGRGVWFMGSASGEVKNNTITLANTGVAVDRNATPLVHTNCIAGNSLGVNTASDRSTTLDLTGNWWGSPDGPQHSTHQGLGDWIYGSPVNFSGWLTSDNCAASDISIDEVETVQVVQGPGNDVPLIAGKSTALRAYLYSEIGQEDLILGEVTAYRDLVELGKWPSYNSAPAGRVADVDELRAERDKGLLFLLPHDWTVPGSLNVRVEANPSHNPEELSYYNNVITETLVFTNGDPLRVAFVPISYQPEATQPAAKADLGQIKEMCRYMQAAFPTDSVTCEKLDGVKWTRNMRADTESMEWRYGRELLTLLNGILMQWNSTHPPAERFHQIVGLFPGGEFEYIRYCLGDPRTIFDDLYTPGLGRASYCWAGEPAIQAMAHNFGLRHANVEGAPCSAPDDWVTGYWRWTYIDNTIQEYGFDFRTGKVVDRKAPDLMSWRCPNTWLSPLHYIKLQESHWIPYPARPGELPVTDPGYMPLAPISGTYLEISGDILLGANGGAMNFAPLWTFTSPLPPETPLDGTMYCFNLQDTSESTLTSRCIDTYYTNYETDTSVAYAPFYMMLPLSSGYSQQTAARLTVTYQGAPLMEVIASPNPPQVTLISPNGDETLNALTPITWQGKDPDGDSLSYRLFFSPDNGASWSLISPILQSTSTVIDLSSFGGTTNGRIRVEASDGFYTASDESDASFTIPSQTPSVSILNPLNGERLDTNVVLRGYAYDPEDGELSGSALSWSSNIDGVLGTGDELVLRELSQGLHQITLTAMDSQNNSATAQVNITFTEPEGISGLNASNDGPGYMHSVVNFQASLESGTNVNYYWDFGDGGYASGASTSHVYTMYGSYSVVVTATNPLGSQATTTQVTVLLPVVPPEKEVYLPVIVMK